MRITCFFSSLFLFLLSVVNKVFFLFHWQNAIHSIVYLDGREGDNEVKKVHKMVYQYASIYDFQKAMEATMQLFKASATGHIHKAAFF